MMVEVLNVLVWVEGNTVIVWLSEWHFVPVVLLPRVCIVRVKVMIVLMVSRRVRWMMRCLVCIVGVVSWVVWLFMVIVRVLPVAVQVVAVHVCLSPDVLMVMVFRSVLLGIRIRIDLVVHIKVTIGSILWHFDSV